jgi:DNA-binding transcriptional LysR family regulator
VADLANHDLLAIPRGAGPTEWPFVVGGKRTSVVIQPRLRTTSFELAVRAAVAGLGIVLTPEHFALEHLRRRRLVPVLARWTQAGVDVHAVTSPGGMRAPKTRLFVEMLVAHFAKIERAAQSSGKSASPEL